jgi:hypothetical protein
MNNNQSIRTQNHTIYTLFGIGIVFTLFFFGNLNIGVERFFILL